MYYVPPTLKIKTPQCFVGRLFVLQKILQTNRMLMVLASCTVRPCGLLGGSQRFGERAASVFSVYPTSTLKIEAVRFYDIST